MQQADIEYQSSDYVEVKFYESMKESLFDLSRLKKICGSQAAGWELIDDNEYEEPESLEFYPDFNDVLRLTLKALSDVRYFVVCVNNVFVYEGTLPHFKLVD